MRIVLDTNILVSAIQFGGLPRLAFQLAIQNHTLLTSTDLLEEFARILIDRFKVPADAADRIMQEYQQTAKLIRPKTRLHIITNDPSDNRVLECATEGKAHVIVSGDKDLLVLKKFRHIPILTVRDFVNTIHRF